MRKTYHAYLLIAPLMAGCLLFYIIPFVLILRHSFLRGSGQSAEFLGLDNYIEVIKNANLTEMEKNLTKLKMANPAVTAADFIESIGGVVKKEPSTETQTDASTTSPKSEPNEPSALETKTSNLEPSESGKSNLSEPSAPEQTSNLNEQSKSATDENNNQPETAKQEAVSTPISQSEVA